MFKRVNRGVKLLARVYSNIQGGNDFDVKVNIEVSDAS